MTKSARICKLGMWVVERPGPTVLAMLLACALVAYPLGSLNPGLPSGIAFTVFVVWMLLVCFRLRGRSRVWCRTSMLWLPFLVLFVYALLVVPMAFGSRAPGHDEPLEMVAACMAGVAYLVIWENIAFTSSAQRGRSRGRAWRYAGLWLVAIMPPLAILWVQHRLRADSGDY